MKPRKCLSERFIFDWYISAVFKAKGYFKPNKVDPANQFLDFLFIIAILVLVKVIILINLHYADVKYVKSLIDEIDSSRNLHSSKIFLYMTWLLKQLKILDLVICVWYMLFNTKMLSNEKHPKRGFV